jgi:hypothetical protein
VQHSASALASHLDAAAPAVAASPFSILAILWNYLTSLVGGLVATPDERAAISDAVMKAYDAAGVAAGKENAVIGMAFVDARSTVKAAVDFMLASFAPAPAPAPPVPVPAPQPPVGSAPN